MNLDLTTEEQARVRLAIKYMKVRFGGMLSLAKALKYGTKTMNHLVQGRKISPNVAFRIARLAGVGVDELLSGVFPPANTCPHCGQVMASP